MKESTSELNATVVVVLAIGVLIAFFYYTIWPVLKENFDKNSQCSKAVCETVDSNSDGFVECYPKGHYGEADKSFECVFKG